MKKFTLFLATVLMVTISFSGIALALPLDVEKQAQIARHIEGKYEWVVAWNNSDGDPDKLKMKNFKFDRNRGIDNPNLDASGDLYGTGDTSVLYIRNDKKKMKKWLKKAVKNDLTDEQTYDFINGKFAAKTKGWKVKGKADGERFQVRVLFGGEYSNPGHEGGGGGTNAQSVPEPATLFLLGVGLLGLSAIRRSRIKTGR